MRRQPAAPCCPVDGSAYQGDWENSFLSKRFNGAIYLCLVVKDAENRRATPGHQGGIGSEFYQPLFQGTQRGMAPENRLFKMIHTRCTGRAPCEGLETIYVIL